jgi:peptidoglycan/xylan/chitin deacetylase (PgdA/CDA1 family)
VRAAGPIKQALRLIGRAFPPDLDRRVVVLCYHSVHPSLPFSSASPGLFADHLAWLRETCRCVPFGRVLEAAGDAHGGPTVAITFDDGYADNHEYALPLLVENGLHATFFLTAGFLESDRSTLERFRSLRGVDPALIRPLRWGQVEELLQAGMDVGAHTVSHPNLARLGDRDLEHELTSSKRIIEDRIGRRIATMAYPFGRPKVHVDARVVEAVGRAGYDLAAGTTTRGVRPGDHPLRLPRFFATQDSVPMLREKVSGLWDAVGIVRERAPLPIARMVSPDDFRF